MATVKFKGGDVNLVGELPAVGSAPADFKLVDMGLGEAGLGDFAGRRKVLNIFPSIDTGVCQASLRTFSQRAAEAGDAAILHISGDLPFALKRFCGAEGFDNAVALSTFRSDFGTSWGMQMTNGLLAGLLARSVVVLDENNKVLYTELVPDIGQEPNYDAALAALKS